MFYLLAYEDVAALGVCEGMDTDDYVHFLLTLNNNRILINPSNITLKKSLNDALRSYIYELISQNRPEYSHYICLLPSDNLAD